MTYPEQLRAITDPAERARAARAHQAEIQAEFDARRDEVITIVRDAVREMRKTMTLARAAAELGVTPGRVQQLEK